MLSVKIEDLQGPALVWAALVCAEGEDIRRNNSGQLCRPVLHDQGYVYEPVRVAQEALDLQEQYGFDVQYFGPEDWMALSSEVPPKHAANGDSPLEVILRLAVRCKCGDTVEVPEDLA